MNEKQVLVLLHAFPMDHTMWEVQAKALRSEYRVFTPDVFGFGDSPLPEEGWSIDDYADELAETLEGLKIDTPIVLGGLSMGGYIALSFAREYPERLRGLILADTRADADSPETKANRDKSIEAMANQTPSQFIEGMIPKVLGETTRTSRPEIVDRVRSIGSKQSREGIAAALAALRDRSDSTASLASIDVPTLLIVGAEDTMTPPILAEGMVNALPKATLEVIPQAGHLSNLEQPEAFTEVLRKWLKTIH